MIRIIGNPSNRRVFAGMSSKHEKMRLAIKDALYEIGQDHKRKIQDLMLSKKTGREYYINGKWHIASAPGEAPAVRSGLLLRGVFYNVKSWNEVEYGNRITEGDKRDYPGYLEDGTKHMEARPSVITATNELERNTKLTLQKYIFACLSR